MGWYTTDEREFLNERDDDRRKKSGYTECPICLWHLVRDGKCANEEGCGYEEEYCEICEDVLDFESGRSLCDSCKREQDKEAGRQDWIDEQADLKMRDRKCGLA